MTMEESLKRFGLVPADADLPAVRALLAHEAALERSGHGGQREDDLARLCCVQLFSRGLLEDVLRIWDAKQSGFDMACYLDVQMICGAGLEATKQFLASQPGEAAREALEYLAMCEAAGDFEVFTPAQYLQWQREYFEESPDPDAQT